MDFQEVSIRAMEVRGLIERYEKEQFGRSWTKEEIALGFVGDVGDLAKLILAESGVRNIPKSKKKLEHELSDCLWSVLVLATLYEIDLEKAFVETMDMLESHFSI